MVSENGCGEFMYESAINKASSSLRWSHEIWNLNLSVASTGRMLSSAIFNLENSLGFGWMKSGIVGFGPLYDHS